MQTYTAFCQASDGRGTIWIDTVGVPSLGPDPEITDAGAQIEAAKLVARIACADAWGCDPDDVHCLGLAKGDVEIVDWEDLNDD